jgi:hypothetical protein
MGAAYLGILTVNSSPKLRKRTLKISCALFIEEMAKELR